jgi:hypothetical protein
VFCCSTALELFQAACVAVLYHSFFTMPPSTRGAALSRLAAGGKGGGGCRCKGLTSLLTLLCVVSFLYATMGPTDPRSYSVRKASILSPSSSLSKCQEDIMGLDESRQLVSLDSEKINNFDNQRLHEIKHLTVEKYEPYLTGKAGQEHYTLLHYLTDNYGDCRHVVDIGTRYVASSLALGSSKKHPVPVWTFDVPQSVERVEAFRGKTEEEWQEQVKALGINITFHNLNLATIPIEEFRKYMSTWLVILDTHHLPKTVPFEREFFARLKEISYTGLLVLDDIYLNKEMKEWWEELLLDSRTSGLFTVYDLTPVGHLSGTGLIDFSPTHADRLIVAHKLITIN